MIHWKVFINSIDESSCFELSHGVKIQVKETDNLVFAVKMNAEDLSLRGSPTVVVGDIPLIMIVDENIIDDGYNFISDEAIYSNGSRCFYNFFGESEVTLYFDNKFDDAVTVTFDILARAENATLADEMLNFLTSNYEDAIAICFSRSRKGADLIGEDGHKFNKIDAIEKAISYLNDSVYKFLRERKSSINNELVLSENGQPTGPDSVYWALTNLDKLSPANQDDVNIYFNNRGYHYEKLPKEISTSNYDVYENRVINSFLASAEGFLYQLKEQYSVSDATHYYTDNSEYVRFDHTMAKFSRMALDVKMKEVEALIVKVVNIRFLFLKIIPSKYKIAAPPRMTSYAATRHHYREAFHLIEKCYRAQAPDFSKNKLLLGLKNLSIIYELAALLMLHKSIENIFDTKISVQNFRQHADTNPFGGIEVERPEGIINNYFLFESEKFLIELLYEAKIYPYSPNSRPGDLIDTSNTYGSIKYGRHHFCPDFILKVTSKEWGNSFTAILDAKFKDLNTVKDYDIDKLTNKYLLNIHSVDASGGLKMSPVDILIVLFAHDKRGNVLRRVAPRHCLTGQFPVFPQSTAIALHPRDLSILEEHLTSLKKLISNGADVRFSNT